MQLKHFEHLANLERNIIKQQFVRAAKQSHAVRNHGDKRPKGNVPQVAAITSLSGDQKLPNPYTAGKTRKYPKNPSEKEIREQKAKTAALVANDGLTPAEGGKQGLMDERVALRGRKPLNRPRPRFKLHVM